MTAINEVELDGLLRYLVIYARCVEFIIPIAVVIDNVYVAVVLDTAPKSTQDDCWVLWASYFDEPITVGSDKVKKLLIKMSRTAPTDRHVRRIGQWRIKTVQVHLVGAVIARNNVTTTCRAFAASVAEDQVAFTVVGLEEFLRIRLRTRSDEQFQ